MERLKSRLALCIHLVSEQCVTGIRHVNAYLMRSSCFELQAEIGYSAEALKHAVMRYGVSCRTRSVAYYRHLFSIHGVPADRIIYRAEVVLKATDYQCVILALDAVIFEFLRECCVCLVALRNDQ